MQTWRSFAVVLAFLVALTAWGCSKNTDTTTETPAPTVAKKDAGTGGGSGKGKGLHDGGGTGPGTGKDEKRGAKMAAKMEHSRYKLGVTLPDGNTVELTAKQIWGLHGEPVDFGHKKWHGARLVDVLKEAGATDYKVVEFFRKRSDFSLTREEIEADPNRYYLIFSKTTDVKLADATANHPGIRKATHLKKLVLK